ncbi:hypothetical protein O6H91_Y573600 [Diphasiastrum complanatum]|nr:hypothetical protein O6H91_Y573600 [Diphasiastrum complanatum]
MQGGSSRWRRILRLIVKALGDAAHSEEQWRSYRSLCDGFSRERGPVPCRHSAGTGFLIGKLLNQGSNSRPVRPSIMMQQVRDAKVLGSDVRTTYLMTIDKFLCCNGLGSRNYVAFGSTNFYCLYQF